MSDMKCPNIKIYKCSDGFVTDNEQVAKSHEANIKSNKPKCPICGNVLEQSDGFPELFMCLNCQINMKHNQWQELIRTRKALEIAVDALKKIDWCATDYGVAQDALDEITELEQKETTNDK